MMHQQLKKKNEERKFSGLGLVGSQQTNIFFMLLSLQGQELLTYHYVDYEFVYMLNFHDFVLLKETNIILRQNTSLCNSIK